MSLMDKYPFKPKLLLVILCASLLCFNGVRINGAISQELQILEWDGGDYPPIYDLYTKKYKNPPVFTFFRDEKESLEYVKKNPNKFHLANICSYNIDNWLSQLNIKEWDSAKLTNWSQLNPQLRTQQSLQSPNKIHFVPLYFGYTMMIYAPNIDKKYLNSLTSFIDPELKGKTAILADGFYNLIAMALMAVGAKDANNINESQWLAAKEFIKKFKENQPIIAFSEEEISEKIVANNIQLAFATPAITAYTKEKNYNMQFTHANIEGTTSWVCGYVNLPNSQNTDEINNKIYDYINAITHQSVAIQYNETGLGHANQVGLKKIPKIDLIAFNLDDVEQKLKKSFFQKTISAEWLDKFESAFQEFLK